MYIRILKVYIYSQSLYAYYMYVHMYIYTCTYVLVCIHTRTCACACHVICVFWKRMGQCVRHLCVMICICICTCARMSACSVYVRVNVYVCVCVHVYTSSYVCKRSAIRDSPAFITLMIVIFLSFLLTFVNRPCQPLRLCLTASASHQ